MGVLLCLIGYVGIEILDKKVLNAAKSVEVVLNNGYVERAGFNDSNILLVPAPRRFIWEKPRLKTIKIYGENDDIIDGFFSN